MTPRDWFDSLPYDERRRVVAVLRDCGGMRPPAIAQLVGIPTRHAYEFANDPFREKARARKARHAGRCGTCKKPKGDARAELCSNCARGLHPWSLRLRSCHACGTPGCRRRKAPGRHVCAEHGAVGSPLWRAKKAYDAELASL